MKFLLLKTLLLRKGKDEGFTLPMVIAIGMVMVLLSTINLVQSGEENLNALSQQGSADALAAAELGVSRYRDFLLNNRVLAVNDLAQWTTFDDETCSVISDTGGGWADTSDATGWQDIELDETILDIDLNSDGDTTDTSVTIGSYRLVAYEYDQNPFNAVDDNNFDQVADANNDFSTPLDGESDATGLLTVRGKDTAGNIPGSVAQIQVTIPLGVNTQDLTDLSPALWIQQNTPTSINDNINVNGANIIYKRDGVCDNPNDVQDSSGTDQNTISDARALPPIFDITGLTRRSLSDDISTDVGTDANFFNSNEIILGTSLDDDDDNDPDNTPGNLTQAQNWGDDYYYYTTDFDDLILDSGESIISDGDSKVILYVAGDLTIRTDDTENETRLVNSQHTSLSSDIARYFEIHVAGDVNIQGDGDLKITGLLRVDGTVNITSSPNIEVIGAIWTNDWNDTGSGTVDITVDDHRFYSITPSRTAAPITYRPSGWQTQEAN